MKNLTELSNSSSCNNPSNRLFALRKCVLSQIRSINIQLHRNKNMRIWHDNKLAKDSSVLRKMQSQPLKLHFKFACFFKSLPLLFLTTRNRHLAELGLHRRADCTHLYIIMCYRSTKTVQINVWINGPVSKTNGPILVTTDSYTHVLKWIGEKGPLFRDSMEKNNFSFTSHVPTLSSCVAVITWVIRSAGKSWRFANHVVWKIRF